MSILEIIGNIEAELVELRKLVGTTKVEEKVATLTDWRQLREGQKLRLKCKYTCPASGYDHSEGDVVKVEHVEHPNYEGDMHVMISSSDGVFYWVNMDAMLEHVSLEPEV